MHRKTQETLELSPPTAHHWAKWLRTSQLKRCALLSCSLVLVPRSPPQTQDGAFVGSLQAAARAQAAGLLTSYISVTGPAGVPPAAGPTPSASSTTAAALRPAARMQSLRVGSETTAATAAAAATIARAATRRIQVQRVHRALTATGTPDTHRPAL